MGQLTNLNIAPYYDDFDESDNFHRVLYRPSFAVQARELTTQQSILQDQIEKLGKNIFKEGAQVIVFLATCRPSIVFIFSNARQILPHSTVKLVKHIQVVHFVKTSANIWPKLDKNWRTFGII